MQTNVIKNDEKLIQQVLTRGVEEVIVRESLEKKLRSGKKLRIKLGIDPTSPNLHIGRAITLLKLQDFQKLGHQIVFIIGDFTGVIGDTSDKDSERPMLKRDAVEENMKTYAEQAGEILDMDKCEVYRNSEWLAKIGYAELGEQADCFSLSDFIDRENIKRRLDAGTRVSLREVLYPLMQGYDSVAVKADVEIGGTDQKFNLLAGRELQKHFKQEPQDIITGPLLEGTDGRKMSSSWGNTITLTAEPNDMYGKIMSIGDNLIIKYFTLTTRVAMEEIAGYEKEMKSGTNPRDIKMKLAREIVKMYHGELSADAAQENFIKVIQKKETPDEMEEIMAEKGSELGETLVKNKILSSKGEFARLVKGKAVNVDGEVISDIKIKLAKTSVIKIGKRRYVRIKI